MKAMRKTSGSTSRTEARLALNCQPVSNRVLMQIKWAALALADTAGVLPYFLLMESLSKLYCNKKVDKNHKMYNSIVSG